MAELIITNGDSAGECLKEVYPDAIVLPWRDLLHEGPVPVSDELSSIRAKYIEKQWGVDAQADFDDRDELLSKLSKFDRISLWFEHDLYDQLQLLQVLNDLNTKSANVLLVQADDYLGQDGPQTIGCWLDGAEPITQAQYNLAKRAWWAFRQDTPEDWVGLLEMDLSALPHLQSSVLRMLEELPSAPGGVSRTERHILEIAAKGAQTPGEIFKVYQSCEDAQFMGDWSFFNRLDGLTRNKCPVLGASTNAKFTPLEGEDAIRAYLNTSFELNPFGQAVLADEEDYADANTIDYWWGGVHITNDNMWRWDSDTLQLAAP
ncbi:MAG: DUF1835 domain-containing protein [Magnetovibrio sp.]|nr:DUF1835 domain-containing protein [Magnetovibrio sp.]